MGDGMTRPVTRIGTVAVGDAGSSDGLGLVVRIPYARTPRSDQHRPACLNARVACVYTHFQCSMHPVLLTRGWIAQVSPECRVAGLARLPPRWSWRLCVGSPHLLAEISSLHPG